MDDADNPKLMNLGVTVPSFGGRPASRGSAARRRNVPFTELVVLSVLAMLIVPVLIMGARDRVTTQPTLVTLSVHSDPSDASVIIDNLLVGRTPLDLQLAAGSEISLRVEAREPYLEYDLFKPYRSTLTLEDDRNLSVWIPRTTAEEQAQQRSSRQ